MVLIIYQCKNFQTITYPPKLPRVLLLNWHFLVFPTKISSIQISYSHCNIELYIYIYIYINTLILKYHLIYHNLFLVYLIYVKLVFLFKWNVKLVKLFPLYITLCLSYLFFKLDKSTKINSPKLAKTTATKSNFTDNVQQDRKRLTLKMQ